MNLPMTRCQGGIHVWYWASSSAPECTDPPDDWHCYCGQIQWKDRGKYDPIPQRTCDEIMQDILDELQNVDETAQ